ncbi:MAG: nucleotidyl transferase AbiEii/AbiGii toxin family protein [Archangium sp.]|nr:nucleotidyl transferase AbiEii/AbiGii toxin family protein [Archangium sp.]
MESALEETRRVLDEEQRPYALIGGLAISARATPRFTHDVDFALFCTDAEAEGLVGSFVRRGWAVDALLMTKSTNRIATVRLTPPRSKVLVDLLFDFTGIERDIVTSATDALVRDGQTMPVATRAHMIAMKVLAFRPKDKVDVDYLLDRATKPEIAVARRALAEMARAGKEPKRDLVGDLDELLAVRAARPVEFVKVPPSRWPKGWTRPPKKRPSKKSGR